TTGPTYRLQLPNVADATGQGQANAWQTYSSSRWKENVIEIDNALDKISQLRGVYFDWKPEYGGNHSVGFIAEEVNPFLPEAVTMEEDGIYAKALDYNKLVPLAIQGINEIINTIDILNAPTTTSSLIIDQNGRFGIATTTPTNILTIGQGRGNAIADGWDVYSSEDYKTEITYLEEQDYKDILDEIEALNTATYRWKDRSFADAQDDNNGKKNFGIIAEEAPERVLSEDGKSISLYDYATFAIAGVKAVKSEVDKLKLRVDELGQLIDSSATPQNDNETSLSGLVLDSEGYAVINKIKSKLIETENLKIKAENAMQSGITIYDSKTGEPYCLYTEYGVPTTRSGECSVVLEGIEPIIPEESVVEEEIIVEEEPVPVIEEEVIIEEEVVVEEVIVEEPIIEEPVIEEPIVVEEEPSTVSVIVE
ncbi:MAG: tail fiber domain-containing protein, partial [Patescibacteria group bacterium]